MWGVVVMPEPFTLCDRDRALLRRAISVTESANAVLADPAATDQQLFLAQQISGLGAAVEQMRDNLLDVLASHAGAYRLGRADVEAEVTARAASGLRLVSG